MANQPPPLAPGLRLLKALLWVGSLVVPATTGCAMCQEAPDTGYEHLNVDLSEHLARVGLGPGDLFEVRVYGEKDLSGIHRVSPTGDIDVPLVGRVTVEGRTPGEIAEMLKQRLQTGYIREAFVSVYVQEYNSKKILVLGEVQKPGTFPYSSKMNVVEAIALAGGFKASANSNYVVVTRRLDGEETRIPVPVQKISEGLAANLDLQAGDIVFVPNTLL
jgi:polysaccharide export outer membrane protein